MLKQFISKLKPDQVLITTATGETCANHFQNRALSPEYQLQNSRVVFYCKDIVLAITNLVVLDNIAESILLLSPTMPVETVSRLAEQFDAEFILTDDDHGLDAWNKDILVVKDFTSELPQASALSSDTGQQTSWVLTTSGTTGLPKMVSHTQKSLTRTTKTNTDMGKKTCWGLLYDYSRFAGMQVVLQALLSGSNLLVPDRNDSLQNKINFFVENGITHLSATPTLWRNLFMSEKVTRMKLKQVTMGGEIADQKILDTATKLFSEARISHIYASTEAGVGFSVNDGKAGFPAEYLHASSFGIELRIVDDILQVRNNRVSGNYEGSSLVYADKHGWVDTGDRVNRKNDRVFFLGRQSGVINVGGENVFPEEVESAILEYNGIVHAKVFGRNNPFTGQVVMAEIVVVPELRSNPELSNELYSYLQSKLTAGKLPALIRVVDTLEENPSGKIMRG